MNRRVLTSLILAFVSACEGQCGDPDPSDSGAPDPTGDTATVIETGSATTAATGDTTAATADTAAPPAGDVGVIDLPDVAPDADPRGLVLFGLPGEGSGRGVSPAGDVNGDGIDDFVLSAPNSSRNRNASGTFFVVFGPVDGTAIDLTTIEQDSALGFAIYGAEEDDSAGVVAGGGDVNGDGFDDIVLGAQFADTAIINEGKAYVVFGKGTGTPVDLADIEADDDGGGFVIRGASRDDSAGASVAIAGDVNNDGLDDILVGATGADPNGNFSGTSYVVFGKTDGGSVDLADVAEASNSAGYELRGASSGDVTGSAVRGIGDLDNDGFDDVVIGASRTDFGNLNASGAVYVVFGKADGAPVELSEVALDTDARGYVIGGVPALFGFAGRSLATGNLDGDNLLDLVIGAPGATFDGIDSGAAYVVFGKTDGVSVDLEQVALDTDPRGFVMPSAAKDPPSPSAFKPVGPSAAAATSTEMDSTTSSWLPPTPLSTAPSAAVPSSCSGRAMARASTWPTSPPSTTRPASSSAVGRTTSPAAGSASPVTSTTTGSTTCSWAPPPPTGTARTRESPTSSLASRAPRCRRPTGVVRIEREDVAHSH